MYLAHPKRIQSNGFFNEIGPKRTPIGKHSTQSLELIYFQLVVGEHYVFSEGGPFGETFVIGLHIRQVGTAYADIVIPKKNVTKLDVSKCDFVACDKGTHSKSTIGNCQLLFQSLDCRLNGLLIALRCWSSHDTPKDRYREMRFVESNVG